MKGSMNLGGPVLKPVKQVKTEENDVAIPSSKEHLVDKKKKIKVKYHLRRVCFRYRKKQKGLMLRAGRVILARFHRNPEPRDARIVPLLGIHSPSS